MGHILKVHGSVRQQYRTISGFDSEAQLGMFTMTSLPMALIAVPSTHWTAVLLDALHPSSKPYGYRNSTVPPGARLPNEIVASTRDGSLVLLDGSKEAECWLTL